MKLTYYGHSCFILEEAGFRIAVDPYSPETPGYPVLSLEADVCLCSHEHGDHGYREAVRLRTAEGVAEKGPSPDNGGNTGGVYGPFRVSSFVVPHDNAGGKKRGMNTVRIFEAGGVKVAHFGDIGCLPDEEQLRRLAGLDAVLIPVGGFYTIDAEEANEIVRRIRPRLAVPMHFRDGKTGYDTIADIGELRLNEKFRRMNYGETISI